MVESSPQVEKEIVPTHILMFDEESSDIIEQGLETRTYRLGLKYSFFNPGDNLHLINRETLKVLKRTKVTEVIKTTFGRIPFDSDTNEKFANKEEQRVAYSSYYPNLGRQIIDDDLFTIIEWL